MPTAHQESAKAESRRLAMALKQEIKQQRSLATEVSQALGRAPQYLTRVFAGRLELKMKDVLGALEILGRDPDLFFHRLYPVSEPAGLDAHRRPLRTLDRMARQLEAPLPVPADDILEKARRILRSWVVGARRTQRAISLELGLSVDALGQALRGNTDLYAWHVFAVLAATGKTADVFFDEACARDERAGLSPRGAVVLSRVLEATLLGLDERLNPKPKAPAEPGTVAKKTTKPAKRQGAKPKTATPKAARPRAAKPKAPKQKAARPKTEGRRR